MSYPSLISSRSRSLVHTPLPQELWAPSPISTSRLRPKPSSEPGDLGQVDPAAGTYLGPSQARVSQLTREQEPGWAGWDKGHHLPGRGPESVSSGWRRTSSSTWLQVRAGRRAPWWGGGSPVFFPCFDPSGTSRPFLLKVLLSGSEMWTGVSSSESGSGPGSSIGDLYPDITRAPSRLLLTAWDSDHRDGTHALFFEMGPWKTKEQSARNWMQASVSVTYFSAWSCFHQQAPYQGRRTCWGTGPVAWSKNWFPPMGTPTQLGKLNEVMDIRNMSPHS